MNHATVWLPEHVVLAIDLHERHFSAQVAADEFARLTGKPVTRSAMIGKWHRLGLRAGKEPVIRKVRAPERKKAVRMVPSPPLSSPPLPSPPPADAEPKLSPRPCDIIGLRLHDQCRWVMSDPRRFPVYYCGGPREFPGDEGTEILRCAWADRIRGKGAVNGARSFMPGTASQAAEPADDCYETPPVAVEALLRVEPLPHFLWEPSLRPR